jgi:beta-glucosidase
VLLKNDGLLPLKAAPARIAVIGPNADSLDALVGNYNGTPSKPVTVLAGLRERFPDAKEDRLRRGHGLDRRAAPTRRARTPPAEGPEGRELPGPGPDRPGPVAAARDQRQFSWGRPQRQARHLDALDRLR